MDYVGHHNQEAAFLAATQSGRLPPVWLLSGPKGIGKASFALRAASYILVDGYLATCGNDTMLALPPDHPTSRLIASGAHPELLRLEREEGDNGKLARNISVDQVRELIKRMRTRPTASTWRAVIIDSIDDCERSAANALLKTLEEPPDHTVIFLISHAPGRLLPTVRSRCRNLRFAPLDADLMKTILRKWLPKADEGELAAIIGLARGSPGRAIALAESRLVETTELLDAIAAKGDADNRLRSELARQMGLASARARYETMLEQAEAMTVSAAAKEAGGGSRAAHIAYERIRDIRRFALSSSEDPATVSFAVGSALASLPAAD